jgi:hypothetical protein
MPRARLVAVFWRLSDSLGRKQPPVWRYPRITVVNSYKEFYILRETFRLEAGSSCSAAL